MLQQCWSTCVLRYWNWQAMLLMTIRSSVSTQDTFFLLLPVMMNSTRFGSVCVCMHACMCDMGYLECTNHVYTCPTSSPCPCMQLFKGVTISQGGVLPNIHSVLLHRKAEWPKVKQQGAGSAAPAPVAPLTPTSPRKQTAQKKGKVCNCLIYKDTYCGIFMTCTFFDTVGSE